ncbi:MULTISPECIES: hypothetical protein [Halolamina]|uniref:Uncharacterized protein n=1 Tax=Halolamina pelagica TaxID=699431 RepID=A0A1I5MAT5_9EURY|nr:MULTISPECIES: hypothetical protein [Halolamina]NHX35924.1 hypothetical protein [Halolamina sp. R1-12]SFP06121.1 hypothetical protein SAMN05216277_101165 [Halolamina pelagica]
MNLYRTSESGLVAVEPLDHGATTGLAAALLRGPGGALGADDVLFVTTAVDDGKATAIGLDAAGDAVVVGAADGEVGSAVVTDALQRASAVADGSYDALDERYEGDSLREAHADYFDREPLAPDAFNGDQRVRLVGPAFAGDAIDLARFLSDREVPVRPVRVEAFGAPTTDEFLVRFASVDGDDRAEADVEGDAVDDDGDQWVAGTDAAGSSSTATAASDDGTVEGADDADASAGPESGEAALADADGPTGEDGRGDDSDANEPLELPVLLEAVSEGVQDRLVGTFDADPEDLVSIERGSELLVRPDHPAYAGGVLRYRLRVESDGTVEFAVNIYGGSEAEKEQMRALIRDHETAIESELDYEVAEGYDGFHGTREFASYDQVAAAEIVDEFDRLVRFLNPRVMRA